MPHNQLNHETFNKSLELYLDACINSDWLRIGELYKFRFAKWLHDRVDFSKQTDEEILKICLDSQDEKYDGKNGQIDHLSPD